MAQHDPGASQEIFSQLANSLQLLLATAKDVKLEDKKDNELQEQTFWEQLETAVNFLTHEVYKVALSFTSPPFPSPLETSSLATNLEKAGLNFYRVYFGTPHDIGNTLQSKIKHSFLGVLEFLAAFVKTLVINNTTKIPLAAGQVDKSCDELLKLPRSNREAVRNTCKEHLGFVEDAMKELEEEIANEPPPRDRPLPDNGYWLPPPYHRWTAAESDLLRAIMGLVKCAKAVLKKLLSTLLQRPTELPQDGTHLDQLATLASKTSDHVDNLVSECSAPLSYPHIRGLAASLKQFLEEFLEQVRLHPLAIDADREWVEFITSAVQHNMEKITSPTIALAQMSVGDQ